MVGARPRIRNGFAICVTLIVLSSCNSQPDTVEVLAIPARFAEEAPQPAILALDAFRDEQNFYVRYQAGDEIKYTGGEWANRIDLKAAPAGAGPRGPYILPLQYHRTTPWASVPEDTVAARILGVQRWQQFRDLFVGSLLPEGGTDGVVLHFDIDDYFLYRDGAGNFHSVPLDEKPSDYGIGRRVSFGDLVQEGVPRLRTFLRNIGIDDDRVVFNTGDTGDYALPFLYVNLNSPLAVFARNEPEGRQFGPGKALPVFQSAGHLTQSHSTAIVFRPISSIYRLFFVAKDVVAETVRPDWVIALNETPIPPVQSGPTMDLDAWELTLDELTGREATQGTIDFLVDGEEFFPRLIDAVAGAKRSVDLRTYIFDNDDYAERIGELLKRRSNEGIDVRMLFDGFGTIVSTMEQQETLPEDWKGTSSVRAFLETDSRIDVRQTPNPWFTGDHVKTILIDRQIAFTGGMNIAREYRFDWHDLMMEVQGPVVDILQDEFNKAWAHAGFFGDYGYFFRRMLPGPNNAAHIGDPMRVLFTRVDDPEIFRVQREAIRNAKRYIYVENAYFTDDALLYELVKARRRGVDVRVIMPLVTDRGPITRNNALAANVMLEHGIRVFVYPGMSHVKAAVFDGWACLGSANWDKWSLSINKELNLATSGSAVVGTLVDRVFMTDFERSPELTEPFPERWSDFLLELIGDYVF